MGVLYEEDQWLPPNFLRPDQRVLVDHAASGQNTLIALPTGSGKTRCASVLIANFLRKPENNRKIVVFLAPTCVLAEQQCDVISENLRHDFQFDKVSVKLLTSQVANCEIPSVVNGEETLLDADTYDLGGTSPSDGGGNVVLRCWNHPDEWRDLWDDIDEEANAVYSKVSKPIDTAITEAVENAENEDEENAEEEVNDVIYQPPRVFIITPDKLIRLMVFGFLPMSRIGLLILDECHHCSARHPYARIMDLFYFTQVRNMPAESRSRPQLLGLTATPILLTPDDERGEGAITMRLEQIQARLGCDVVSRGYDVSPVGEPCIYNIYSEAAQWNTLIELFVYQPLEHFVNRGLAEDQDESGGILPATRTEQFWKERLRRFFFHMEFKDAAQMAEIRRSFLHKNTDRIQRVRALHDARFIGNASFLRSDPRVNQKIQADQWKLKEHVTEMGAWVISAIESRPRDWFFSTNKLRERQNAFEAEYEEITLELLRDLIAYTDLHNRTEKLWTVASKSTGEESLVAPKLFKIEAELKKILIRPLPDELRTAHATAAYYQPSAIMDYNAAAFNSSESGGEDEMLEGVALEEDHQIEHVYEDADSSDEKESLELLNSTAPNRKDYRSEPKSPPAPLPKEALPAIPSDYDDKEAARMWKTLLVLAKVGQQFPSGLQNLLKEAMAINSSKTSNIVGADDSQVASSSYKERPNKEGVYLRSKGKHSSPGRARNRSGTREARETVDHGRRNHQDRSRRHSITSEEYPQSEKAESSEFGSYKSSARGTTNYGGSSRIMNTIRETVDRHRLRRPSSEQDSEHVSYGGPIAAHKRDRKQDMGKFVYCLHGHSWTSTFGVEGFWRREIRNKGVGLMLAPSARCTSTPLCLARQSNYLVKHDGHINGHVLDGGESSTVTTSGRCKKCGRKVTVKASAGLDEHTLSLLLSKAMENHRMADCRSTSPMKVQRVGSSTDVADYSNGYRYATIRNQSARSIPQPTDSSDAETSGGERHPRDYCEKAAPRRRLRDAGKHYAIPPEASEQVKAVVENRWHGIGPSTVSNRKQIPILSCTWEEAHGKAPHLFCQEKGIIFMKTRLGCALLQFFLEKRGLRGDASYVGCTMAVNAKATLYTASAGKTDQERARKLFAESDVLKEHYKVIVATSVLAEGVNITACSFVFKADKVHSVKDIVQTRGRIRLRGAADQNSYLIFVESSREALYSPNQCDRIQHLLYQEWEINNFLHKFPLISLAKAVENHPIETCCLFSKSSSAYIPAPYLLDVANEVILRLTMSKGEEGVKEAVAELAEDDPLYKVLLPKVNATTVVLPPMCGHRANLNMGPILLTYRTPRDNFLLSATAYKLLCLGRALVLMVYAYVLDNNFLPPLSNPAIEMRLALKRRTARMRFGEVLWREAALSLLPDPALSIRLSYGLKPRLDAPDLQNKRFTFFRMWFEAESYVSEVLAAGGLMGYWRSVFDKVSESGIVLPGPLDISKNRTDILPCGKLTTRAPIVIMERDLSETADSMATSVEEILDFHSDVTTPRSAGVAITNESILTDIAGILIKNPEIVDHMDPEISFQSLYDQYLLYSSEQTSVGWEQEESRSIFHATAPSETEDSSSIVTTSKESSPTDTWTDYGEEEGEITWNKLRRFVVAIIAARKELKRLCSLAVIPSIVRDVMARNGRLVLQPLAVLLPENMDSRSQTMTVCHENTGEKITVHFERVSVVEFDVEQLEKLIVFCRMMSRQAASAVLTAFPRDIPLDAARKTGADISRLVNPSCFFVPLKADAESFDFEAMELASVVAKLKYSDTPKRIEKGCVNASSLYDLSRQANKYISILIKRAVTSVYYDPAASTLSLRPSKSDSSSTCSDEDFERRMVEKEIEDMVVSDIDTKSGQVATDTITEAQAWATFFWRRAQEPPLCRAVHEKRAAYRYYGWRYCITDVDVGTFVPPGENKSTLAEAYHSFGRTVPETKTFIMVGALARQGARPILMDNVALSSHRLTFYHSPNYLYFLPLTEPMLVQLSWMPALMFKLDISEKHLELRNRIHFRLSSLGNILETTFSSVGAAASTTDCTTVCPRATTEAKAAIVGGGCKDKYFISTHLTSLSLTAAAARMRSQDIELVSAYERALYKKIFPPSKDRGHEGFLRKASRRAIRAAMATQKNEDEVEWHNQRLEFLGDAILKVVAGIWAFFACPASDEGQLSIFADKIKSNAYLQRCCRKEQLQAYLWAAPFVTASKGRRGGQVTIAGLRQQPVSFKMQADIMEALIGAVYFSAFFNTQLWPTLQAGAGETNSGISLSVETPARDCTQIASPRARLSQQQSCEQDSFPLKQPNVRNPNVAEEIIDPSEQYVKSLPVSCHSTLAGRHIIGSNSGLLAAALFLDAFAIDTTSIREESSEKTEAPGAGVETEESSLAIAIPDVTMVLGDSNNNKEDSAAVAPMEIQNRTSKIPPQVEFTDTLSLEALKNNIRPPLSPYFYLIKDVYTTVYGVATQGASDNAHDSANGACGIAKDTKPIDTADNPGSRTEKCDPLPWRHKRALFELLPSRANIFKEQFATVLEKLRAAPDFSLEYMQGSKTVDYFENLANSSLSNSRLADAWWPNGRLALTENLPLVTQCRVHRSAIPILGTDFGSYERLEFLGDCLLSLLLAEWLYEAYPDLREGDLSKAKSVLQSNSYLARKLIRRLGSINDAVASDVIVHSATLNLMELNDLQERLRHTLPAQDFKDCWEELKKRKKERNKAKTAKIVPEAVIGDTNEEVGIIVAAVAKYKLIADVYEALIGATWVASGFDLRIVWSVIKQDFEPDEAVIGILLRKQIDL